MNTRQHNLAVNEFLRRQKEKNTERYKEICKKYPTLTPQQWQQVHQNEIPYSPIERDAIYGTDEAYEEN